MKKTLLFILLIAIFMYGCTLKRSNPLDPVSHPDLNIPQDITNILITHSGAHTDYHWVNLQWRWQSQQSADGYYIYRGQSYNGAYQKIHTVTNTPAAPDTIAHSISWRDTDDNTDTGIVPGTYFYKISAFKRQGSSEDSILEGPISSYQMVTVPQ